MILVGIEIEIAKAVTNVGEMDMLPNTVLKKVAVMIEAKNQITE